MSLFHCKRFDERVLRWFSHVERMENNRIARRVYVGEWEGSYLEGQLQKWWIDTVKDCLKNRALNVRLARRMMYNKSECKGL